MESVQWGPPLMVLVVGAALGLLLVWRIRSSGAPRPPAPDLEARDLEARRDALVRQLRELEDAPREEPERVARERYRLELEAAAVLRALDARPAPAAPAPEAAAEPAPAAPAAPASALSGFLWGAGSMVAIGLLLFAVSRDAAERREGGSVTGNLPGEETAAAPPAAAPRADAELSRLLAAVEREPENLEARLELAQAHLMRQDLMSVFQETQFVLDQRPEDPRALSYQSLVRLAMGQPQLAVEMLEKAIAVEPDYLEAYVHLALVHTQTGNLDAAQAAVTEAGRRHPDQAPALERLFDDMRRASAEAPPLPEGQHPPVGEAPSGTAPAAPAAAPAAADGPGFAGTIRLAPDAGSLPPGAVIYIYVREAGYETGAPNAVQRLVPRSMPLAFHITAADSMMGGELPESARLEARVDRDGDVSTRDPADPTAALDAVPIGSDDLELVLRVRP